MKQTIVVNSSRSTRTRRILEFLLDWGEHVPIAQITAFVCRHNSDMSMLIVVFLLVDLWCMFLHVDLWCNSEI
jgi:hypothetical protein